MSIIRKTLDNNYYCDHKLAIKMHNIDIVIIIIYNGPCLHQLYNYQLRRYISIIIKTLHQYHDVMSAYYHGVIR